MTKLIAFTILIALLTIIFGVHSSVSAASPLEVSFSSTPMFAQTDWKPGSSATKTFMVKNTDAVYRNIKLKAINVVDDAVDPLSKVISFQVSVTGNILFASTLYNFYQQQEVNLGGLNPGQSQTYTVTLMMDDSVPGKYQAKNTGFDLWVGYDESVSGGTVVFGPFPAFPRRPLFAPFQSMRGLFHLPVFPPFPQFGWMKLEY